MVVRVTKGRLCYSLSKNFRPCSVRAGESDYFRCLSVAVMVACGDGSLRRLCSFRSSHLIFDISSLSMNPAPPVRWGPKEEHAQLMLVSSQLENAEAPSDAGEKSKIGRAHV